RQRTPLRSFPTRRSSDLLSCLDFLDELHRRRHVRMPPDAAEEKRSTVTGGEVQEWLRAFADVGDEPALEELGYPYNLDNSPDARSEEDTSELQSQSNLVC